MTDTQTGVLHGIDVVVFDVFGTLVEITDRRRPFAHLRRKMSPEKANRFRRMAMTTELTLAELDAEIKGGATIADLSLAQVSIAHEVASTRLRPGIPEMLAGLRHPYGLCSNLSTDYVPAVFRFPEIRPLFRILSCQVGYMKPEAEIYRLVIEAAGVPASRLLFVGDTPAADIEGPRSAGMRAIHIDQFMAALASGRTGHTRKDDFNAAFRDARGTISPDLDLDLES
jgi:HAD superfamily hydrolase (TIGR01509 family)